MSGPLNGYRILEIAGIGPGPFAAMMLADMGAEVIRIDRAQSVKPGSTGPVRDVLLRSRKSIALDLKDPEGIAILLDLVEGADALIEGFRPGVMERLGIGPDVCLERNPKLVFGRMTGWGQTGPYSQAAGHDINYIALGGALAHITRGGCGPVPPLNLVGDFGGGGMFLAYGVVCGLLEAQRSGSGQVIDTAMVDGTASLMSMFWGMAAMGAFDTENPGTNLLDTGAHFYDTYECSDGKWISLGSIEPQFYALLLEHTGLTDDADFQRQMDKSKWPELKTRLTELFLSKTRDEWCAIMEHTDICFAPVLTMPEAAHHPHNVDRGTFCEVDGLMQASPAPRFSRTAPDTPTPGARPGEHTKEVLLSWGLDAGRIDAAVAGGAAAQA